MVSCNIIIGSSNISLNTSSNINSVSCIVYQFISINISCIVSSNISCNISSNIITPNGGDKLGAQVYFWSQETGFLHPADIFCYAGTVFLDIAHLVHHFRQVRVVRIGTVFFHQVSFGEFNWQCARIAHHDTVAEDRNLNTPSAVVVAMGYSVHNGFKDDGAR